MRGIRRKKGAELAGSGNAASPEPNETPYDLEEFAAKYGLPLKTAEVVLMANGPSRQKSDAGARAFVAAVAAYRRR